MTFNFIKTPGGLPGVFIFLLSTQNSYNVCKTNQIIPYLYIITKIINFCNLYYICPLRYVYNKKNK